MQFFLSTPNCRASCVLWLLAGLQLVVPSVTLFSQPVVIDWPTSFEFPGPANIVALAAEGDEIIALNSDGLHRFADGRWEAPIEVVGLPRALHHPGISLHEGEMWVVDADGRVVTWDGTAWLEIAYEPNPMGGSLSPNSLLSHAGELYLLPFRYRWDGSTFRPTLPDSIGRVDDAVVSRSGDWLIGTVEDQLFLLTQNTLRPLPELPQGEEDRSWLYFNALAFHGDAPVVFGSTAVHRLEGETWVRVNDGLRPVDGFGPFELVNSLPFLPKRFGGRLLVAMRGELLFNITGSTPHPFPFDNTCQNRLYELRNDGWHRMNAFSEARIQAIAFSGGDEYLVAGEFKPSGVPAIGEGVVRIGSAGRSPVTGHPQNYTGVAGEIKSVLTDGNLLYVGGSALSSHAHAPASLLRYQDGEWYAEIGISGEVCELEFFEGSIYAAGDLIVDSEAGTLAVKENGSWRIVEEITHGVTAISVADGQLLVGGGPTADGGPGGISRIREGAVSTIFPEVDFDVADIATLAGSVYVASRSGRVYRVTPTGLEQSATVSGGPVIWHTDDPGSSSALFRLDSIVLPSINALHRHRDMLYIGGTFDSINGVPASNIAKFDGQVWSSVDSGVTGRSNVVYWACTGLDRESHLDDLVHSVDALTSAGEYLVVGGLFTHVGTRDVPSSQSPNRVHLERSRGLGGMELGFPVALFDPVASEWRQVAETGGGNVSNISFGGGKLAIAGDFSEINGVEAQGVALSDRFTSAPVAEHPREMELTQRGSGVMLRIDASRGISVLLYDLLGSEVAVLLEGRIARGEYHLRLPDGLPPGQYVVGARSQDGSAASLVIVLR